MSALGIILAFIGGVIGAATADAAGFIFGLVAGYSLGAVIHLSGRVRLLEQQIGQLRQLQEAGAETVSSVDVAPVSATASRPSELPPEPEFLSEPIDIDRVQASTETNPAPARHVPPAPATARPRIPQEAFMDRLLAHIYRFFTDGNVVVKVGLLVLFVGIGFLLKYAAAHSMLPVQLRIAGVGLGGIALLVVGWRLRASRRLYALLLQGGGVGVMYLAVFAAAKLYHLLPVGFSFTLMVALVVLSGILAVLQDAKYLAFYGSAGGFLAPVLASTGGGSHVMLFSYYALLNLGILGIAWYRSWRELNLLGFVFTFVIGMLWGAQYYRPAYFNSVEPFLILFFIFFVAIAILFAFRQPPQLKGYIDSTLVFGVPVIAFGLQAALVKHMHYGLAFSALGLSAIYITLARTLWSRAEQGLRLLTEAFLAMGVVFGSLAIPLALDGRWTSVAWSMEGAAIVWVGVRQQRLLARSFGLLLQAGSGFFFLQAVHQLDSSLPIVNGVFLGAMIISVTGLFSSYYLYRHSELLRDWERGLHIPLLVWGVCWWLGAGINEIQDFIHPWQLELNIFLVVVSASLLFAHYLEYRLAWKTLRYPVLGQLYAMLALFILILVFHVAQPFAWYGWLTWPLAFAALYTFLYRYRDTVQAAVLRWQHITGFWLVVSLLTWGGAWLTHLWIKGHTWRDVMYMLIPALIMLLLMTRARRLSWPFRTYYDWYIGQAALPVMLGMGVIATVMGLFHNGDPWPIHYLPVVNPLDLSVGLVLYTLVLWRRLLGEYAPTMHKYIATRSYAIVLATSAFLWLNGIIARSVHFWFGVRHDAFALTHSTIFQASISVAWTVTAMLVMWLASRRGQRGSWFIGLGLFLATVAKLFLVDIAEKNELTMILSLIIVAIVAIVFGYYLSPLPPRREERA